LIYLAAIPLSFVQPWITCACYVLVAILWLLPDPRIEKTLGKMSLGTGQTRMGKGAFSRTDE